MALIAPRLRDLMSEDVIVLVHISTCSGLHYTAVNYTLVQQLHKVKVVKQRHTVGKCQIECGMCSSHNW